MAIQNDNTLVTKGDLKSLYTDKIAPYLGGGISYYYTDRTGEELKSCYASLSSAWTATANTNVPFIKRTGEFIQPSTGLFTIPNGTKVEVVYTFGGNPGGDSTFGLYNNTDSLWITADGTDLKMIDPFIQSGYNYGSVLQVIWKNETGHDVDVAIRCNGVAQSTTLAVDRNALTIKEIGRIVDPVKYVDNNSDLEETPVGNIISYMGNSVPKHYLACDGTAYSIGTYPELEAFIINEFGSINYFGGNGSTTWAVPDLRGEFLRGAGENSHAEQGSGDYVGVHQDATTIPYLLTSARDNTLTTFGNTTASNADQYQRNDSLNRDSDILGTVKSKILTFSTSSTSTSGGELGGSTTRPTNTSVQYCIKYESTYHAFFSNAAYKVSVAASVASYSGAAIAITLDNSDIIGDASLVSGNSFIAPLDGLYLIGMNWSNNGVWEQNYMINVNGTDVYHVVGIGVTDMLQLQKGDVVTIKTSKTSAQSGRASFALITSNYNPTIVSADSVYSENEQMIGYWKDGKPLYQKTVSIGTESSTGMKTYTISIANTDIVMVDFSHSFHYRISGTKEIIPISDEWDAGNTGGYLIQPSTNNFKFFWYRKLWNELPALITFQYTKTTDTASTLQIENSLLLNRPDLWEVGTEYHFGGGLYGIRKTGTITAASDERVWTAIVATSSGNLPSIVDSGGWIKWGDEGTHDYKYSINSTLTGLAGWGNTLGAWSVMRTGDTQIALWNTSGLPRTNAPYDVWVTYTK